MKKIFSLLFVILVGLNYTYSQSVEVHGIETKSVCLSGCDEDGKVEFRSRYCSSCKNYPVIGYELTNTNTFPVSVEVELHHVIRKGEGTVTYEMVEDVKYFNLAPNESYVWKPFYGSGVDITGTSEGFYSLFADYYIRCKAFKK